MKQNKLIISMLMLLCACCTLPAIAESKQIAFPGAEGFGRYATGGRGGTVYHVTNLNDSGDGSLRWALGQNGKKIIVFDVSGTIKLLSQLKITDNTTIAGQSAPGDGICVSNFPCIIDGNNVIVRYMRFRLGNEALKNNANAHEGDGFGALDKKNIIIDHCSVSWSIDECLSMGGCSDITVQWCLVAQSLVNAGHSKGAHGYGGNWGGAGATYHHNLLAHHTSRAPRLGPRPTTQTDERMDMRNNVIYNWSGEGCYGGEGMNINIVNNYYKPGPGTKAKYPKTGSNAYKQMRIASVGIRNNKYIEDYGEAYRPALHLIGSYYVTGNKNTEFEQVTNDNWTYGMYNQIDPSGWDGLYTDAVKEQIKRSEPINYVFVTNHTADKAYDMVTQWAGASLHRDALDEQFVNDVKNGTATATGSGLDYGFINVQTDNTAIVNIYGSAWPTLNSTTAPTDTDGDGMPDDWEDAHELDKNNAADGSATPTGSGYTNIEIYLNSLVSEITDAQNIGGAFTGEAQEGELENVEYTLSNTTHTNAWNFENNISVTATSIPTYSGNGETFLATSNKQYTINLPKDVIVTTVKIHGYNVSNPSRIKELNGTELDVSAYTFTGGSNNAKEYTFNDINASGTLTFTVYKNTQVKITLIGVKHNEIVGESTGGDDGGSQTGGSDEYTYTIAPSTHEGDWNFSNDISISTDKDYGENHIGTFYGIKYSRNVDFTINLPEDIAINTVEVEGWSNATSTDSPQYQYITKLGNNTFNESEHTFGTSPSKHTYTLANPAIGTMVFRNAGGKQLICAITLIGSAATDIKTIKSSEQRLGDDAIYNLQGVRVQNPTQRGIYIRNGKKFVVK